MLKILSAPAPQYRMPKDEGKQAELFAVAELVTQGNRTKEIGRILGMAQAKVRKLRTLARRLSLYRVDYSRATSPLVVEKARQMASHSAAFELLRQVPGGQHLKYYRCVVSGSAQVPSDAPLPMLMDRLKVFSREAAPYLSQTLTNARTTLITYGTTLEMALKATDFRQLDREFAVYPACCDPFEYHHESWCSTGLSHWVTRELGRPVDRHPSLAGMLPIIAPQLGLKVREALAEHFKKAPDYMSIYGPAGLAGEANCLITSIGRSAQPWRMGDDYFAKTIGIDRNDLNNLIIAEIGSVPLPKENLKPEEKSRFEKINAARLGLGLEHIERIATKAASSPDPGVVVLALGANKARCFLELVRRGLINVAIVDNSLEAELLTLLGGKSLRPH